MDGMTDTAPPRASSVVDSPMDLIHYSIDDQILLKCKFGREIRGKLHVRLIFTYTPLYHCYSLTCT
jgi:hypothetical protein